MEARSRAVRVFAGEGLIWLCQSLCLFHLYNMVKNSLFLQFSIGGIHGISPVILLELQRKKHQPFPVAQPKILEGEHVAAAGPECPQLAFGDEGVSAC